MLHSEALWFGLCFGAFVPPHATLNARIVAELLSKHLRAPRDRIVPTASLEELGASPLSLVQVLLAIEDRFGIDIPVSVIVEFRTVEDVMACVARARRG